MTARLPRMIALTATAAFVFGPSAMAQDPSGDSTANILPTLAANFFQDLSFGTIAPSTTSDSTVRVLRGDDNISICGPGLTCFENGNRARIRITGAPGYRFSLSNPGSTTLTDGAGNSMLVDTFVGGGSGTDDIYGRVVQIRPNGIVNLNIGATLHISANQPVGVYTGTYTVTASYE